MSSNRSVINRVLVAVMLSADILSAVSGQAQTNATTSAASETIQVPASGEAVMFKTSFDLGEIFLLKASGTATVGGATFDAGHENSGADVVAGTDVGVDTGLKNLRIPEGVVPGRLKWFSGHRDDHTYYLLATGNGQPLTLKLVTGEKHGGLGAIHVSLFRLSSEPILPAPLETLQIPVLEQTNQTVMTTSNGVIYLLRCTGEAKVGGNGLGLGDAEYMDYQADGSGQEDIGDANTDYGLGVDEADQSKTPRQHWWGPWRKDHTYYQLYAGTGQPIHFFYYDVKGGYGDNSRTDRLTINLFPVP